MLYLVLYSAPSRIPTYTAYFSKRKLLPIIPTTAKELNTTTKYRRPISPSLSAIKSPYSTAFCASYADFLFFQIDRRFGSVVTSTLSLLGGISARKNSAKKLFPSRGESKRAQCITCIIIWLRLVPDITRALIG